MEIDVFGKDLETEIEYEWEPEEMETPTSPPYPPRVLIYAVKVMSRLDRITPWVFVDILPLLDQEQRKEIKARILNYGRKSRLKNPANQHYSCSESLHY
jgi:hypothetical protein